MLADSRMGLMAKFIYSAALIFALSGCAGIPKDAFLLPGSSLEDKQLQSRNFATGNEPSLLKAGVEILENMGYKPDIVATDLGLITATKIEAHRGTAATFLTILSAGLASVDEDKIIKATFTTMPSRKNSDAFITRITFQHIVFNSDGEATSIELLRDKEIYKLFYERLEASMFIEPDKI